MATTVQVSIKVEDFAKWKAAFDGAAPMREKMGIDIKGIYQHQDDEKQVSILSEYPSIEAAQSVLNSPHWAETQRQAGVIGGFDITYLNKIG